jgi:hypothetical protein
MKNTYTIGLKDLADLLAIASAIGDEDWKITDWILDVLGMPPESEHDWNSVSEQELEEGFCKEGFVLCCRDKMHSMHSRQQLDRTKALSVVASWIESIRIAEK